MRDINLSMRIINKSELDTSELTDNEMTIRIRSDVRNMSSGGDNLTGARDPFCRTRRRVFRRKGG